MARKAIDSARPISAASIAAVDSRLGAPLSLRQNEILGLIAQGKSNKEIAHQLGLTTGTVKQHVYALFRKLGVRNRTTAAARGAALGGEAVPAAAAPVPQSPLPEELRFARRLVTAVVVEPRPALTHSSRDAAEAEARVQGLRARVERLAFAFDARAELLSGGGIAVWFGRPYAHGDDAQRAVAFARALERQAVALAGVPSAIGIGTAAELVGEGAHGSIAYRTFRTATLLASLAEPGAPLACSLTAEFAGLHDGEEPAAAVAATGRSLPEGAHAVGPAPAPSLSVANQWGGLPFVSELVANVRRRRSQWLAIESWPPEAGTRLIGAIGGFLGARGFSVRDLWLPAQASRGEVARRLIGQLHEGYPASGLVQAPAVLRDAVATLAAERPVVLLAYGIDGLQLFKSAIGEVGLQRLREVPLIVAAGSMHRTGEPQTVVRLLGSHPGSSPFVRVMRMQVPAQRARSLQGIRPDVQAVLDAVSPDARAIARIASNPKSSELAAVAGALGLAVQTVIEFCHEFESSGLLSVVAGRVVFRDETTAAAVRASLA